MRLYLDHFWALMTKVSSWTKMTDGNLSTSMNGVSLMGILDGRPGDSLQDLQHLNVKAPRSVSVPDYGPTLKLGALEDRHSLQSVDSGIPTLEIGNPEPVPCSVVHVKRKQSESEVIPERAFQSACPLPSCAPLAPTSSEQEQVVRKSSTFPRTGYDSVKLYSPTSKALSRSDNVSVCSVSSLGTELSTTLSVSNEDILDLMVTSSSSAIVTLENDDDRHFTDVTLSSIKETKLKEAQRRKKQLEERCKVEESIGNAVLTWNNEILPNWETMWCSKKVRDLWWQGIPPSVRGKVWSLAIGNELNITHELFDICLARAKERWRSLSTGGSEAENEDAGFSAADREASLELIKLDISRTFPNLCIFQQGGPYHDMLHSILGAYTCYRPDVGYVQGMSFIAAVLILNLDTADAFIAFSNLLNKPCQMAFFRVDHGLMLTYFAAFEVFFEENLPKLFAHFKKNNLTADIYLIDWIFTLYSKSLPLDLACRIWDVFCRDGEEFLFRTALGILKLFEDILTRMDFIHSAQFLTRLPEDLPADEVFAAISTVQMQSRNKKWAQVLSALQKDSREMEKGSPSLRH
ncbi:Tbc1d14 [Phodopus roborovskii]|uniref:Tbc1d14 protein n=2 Tax=Phodopus roborovskii TaxID=109678 RepID=A0AAU9ZXB3_PHORO|nr:Tbc1d14 [Phodopus roborovskii]